MATQVTMVVQMTGTRNGVAWPAKGTMVTVPDGEAAQLIGNGLAALPTSKTKRPSRSDIHSASPDVVPVQADLGFRCMACGRAEPDCQCQ